MPRLLRLRLLTGSSIVGLSGSEDGNLSDVPDRNLAELFDPAVDAASMTWHGWQNIRQAVDSYVQHIVAWLEWNADRSFP